MTPHHFLPSFPWARYSKKLIHRIETPLHVGSFSKEDAAARGMRLAIGKEGEIHGGHALCLYLLVDESDGVIADAKFEAFGPTALIGAADIACELLIRKNHDQARRLSADLIDKQAHDRNDSQAFPNDVSVYLNLVLFAIEEAVNTCMDIPLSDNYIVTPVISINEGGGGYPGWSELSGKQKIAVLEEVIANDIRPYIELDAGGIQIIDFVNEKELIIAYQGSCTTCYSATGSTLSAIQQILRAKISPDLVVTPDLSSLAKT
ncbi:MAG: iron-sulfur cluster assembly scaffold protein [Simkania sp.]|nr:iron-sulfur cluster assembly scaffold protein [Simkania sp.]